MENLDSKIKITKTEVADWKRRKRIKASDPIFEIKTQNEHQVKTQIQSKEENDSFWQVKIDHPESDYNNMIVLESSRCLVASGKLYFPIHDLKRICLSESSDETSDSIILPSQKRWH